MSTVDPGVEEAGPSWTRHNIADHDDVATTGLRNLSRLVFDGSTGKWTASSNIAGGGAGALPTVAAGANNGTTPPAPTVTAGGTDSRGTVNFGSGASAAAGAQVVVTFKNPLAAGVVPYIHLQETNSATKALGVFPTAITNTGFTVSSGAPTASQAAGTYVVEYHVEV